MDGIFQVLMMVLPAVVVFLTAFFLLKQLLDRDRGKNMLDLKKESMKVVTPIRLQAHERLVLFLERIAPQSIVMRVHKNGMSARLLQTELLNAIRSEFEHNVSQQLYVSNEAWVLVKRAKEETIKMVNLSSTKVNDNATGIDLSNALFKLDSELSVQPNQTAIDYLKKEIRMSF